MKKQRQIIDAETVLHENGFKRTPLRVALLEILSVSPAPLSVAHLVRKTKKIGADTASIYRALKAFVEAEVVTALTVDKTKALYELASKNHFHHIVCDSCHTVESVPFCVKTLDQQVVKLSRQFKKVHSHQLAFIGTCRKCLRAVR